MSKIKRIERALERFLNKTATTFSRDNPVLLSVARSKKYKEIREEITNALLQQSSELLRRQAVKDSVQKIRKQNKNEWTERDREEVNEKVRENIRPLNEYIDPVKIVDFFVYCANKGGQAFLDKVGIDEEFDILGDKDLTKLQKANIETERSRMFTRADRLIIQLDETSQEHIVNSINRGREKGFAYNDIANDLRDKMPEYSEGRAERIARTEMGELVNDTEMRAARMNDAEKKTWSAAGPNICEECEENDGKTRGLDGIFPSGHIRPPVHPNCKCLLEYGMPPIKPRESWSGGDKQYNINEIEADLDRMYHRATSAKNELDGFATEIAKNIVGARVVKAPLKGRARAVQKTLKDYGGNPAAITDIARNSVVVKKGKDVLDTYERLKVSKNVVKAKIQRTSLGYDGSMLKYKTKTGHIGEMQIVTEKMIYAKEPGAKSILGEKVFNRIKRETGLPHGKGHEYYEEWRVAETIIKKTQIERKSSKYYAKFKD